MLSKQGFWDGTEENRDLPVKGQWSSSQRKKSRGGGRCGGEGKVSSWRVGAHLV